MNLENICMLVFDQQFAMEYFQNCSNNNDIMKISRVFFGTRGISNMKLYI